MPSPGRLKTQLLLICPKWPGIIASYASNTNASLSTFLHGRGRAVADNITVPSPVDLWNLIGCKVGKGSVQRVAQTFGISCNFTRDDVAESH